MANIPERPASKIFQTISITAGDQEKSYNWYKNQVNRLAKGITGIEILEGERFTKLLQPGNMYLFLYDPKHKETLPYYDTVPLVIPFRIVPNGFLGINLHYLPYGLRFKMTEELMKLSEGKYVNQNTKIKLSWQYLNNAARLAPVKDCVKHYLSPHLRSRFMKISFTDWKTAVMLPVQNFKKGSPY